MAKSRRAAAKANTPKRFLAEVRQAIEKKNLRWEAGDTIFADMSPEEASKYTGYAVSEEELRLMGAKWQANEEFYRRAVGAPFLPAVIDWRNVTARVI